MNITILKLVLNTLNDIDIKGKKNIDAMLGCMNALEEFIHQAENKKESEVVENG